MMPFERNDQVRIFGKTWRIDWRDRAGRDFQR
jgi:hypothetical protein